jgi:polysaccharide pyruvyl transferase WcaK-like protein
MSFIKFYSFWRSKELDAETSQKTVKKETSQNEVKKETKQGPDNSNFRPLTFGDIIAIHLTPHISKTVYQCLRLPINDDCTSINDLYRRRSELEDYLRKGSYRVEKFDNYLVVTGVIGGTDQAVSMRLHSLP